MNNSLLAVQTQLPKMTLNKASALQSNSPTYFASLVEQLAKPITSDLGSTALPSDPKAAEIDTESMEDVRIILQSFLSQAKDKSVGTDNQQAATSGYDNVKMKDASFTAAVNKTALANKPVTAWDFIEQSVGKETLEAMLPDGMKERIVAGLKDWKLDEGIEPITYLTDRLEQLDVKLGAGLQKQNSEELELKTIPEQNWNVKQANDEAVPRVELGREITKNTEYKQGESHEMTELPELIAVPDYKEPKADLLNAVHTGEQADPDLTEQQIKNSLSITPSQTSGVTDLNSEVEDQTKKQANGTAVPNGTTPASIGGDIDQKSAIEDLAEQQLKETAVPDVTIPAPIGGVIDQNRAIEDLAKQQLKETAVPNDSIPVPIDGVKDKNRAVEDNTKQQLKETTGPVYSLNEQIQDQVPTETNQLINNLDQVLATKQDQRAAEKTTVSVEIPSYAESDQLLPPNNSTQQILDNYVNNPNVLSQNVISAKNFNMTAKSDSVALSIRQQTTSNSSVISKGATDQMTASNGKVLQNTVMDMMQELNGEISSNNRKSENAIVALSARQQFAAMMHQKAEMQNNQSAQQSIFQQTTEAVSDDSPAVADKSVILPTLQTSKPEQLIFHLKQAASSQEEAGKELVQKLEQVMLQRSEIRNGSMELSIKLRPHNLGDIQIKLLQQDGQTMVQIMTSSKQAKEMLDANMSSLKHIFAPHQITLMDRADQLPANHAERNFEQHKQNGGQAGQQQREQQQQQERDYDDQSFSEFMSEFERSSI